MQSIDRLNTCEDRLKPWKPWGADNLTAINWQVTSAIDVCFSRLRFSQDPLPFLGWNFSQQKMGGIASMKASLFQCLTYDPSLLRQEPCRWSHLCSRRFHLFLSLLCSRWTYDTPGATILHYPSVETRVVVCHFMTTTVLLYATSVVWNVCLTNFPRKFKFFSPFFEVSLKGSHSLALIVLCSRSRAVGWKVARLVLGRKVAPVPNWSKVVRSITLFTTVYSTRDYSIINWSKGLFNYIPISLYIPNNPIGVRLLQFAPKQ